MFTVQCLCLRIYSICVNEQICWNSFPNWSVTHWPAKRTDHTSIRSANRNKINTNKNRSRSRYMVHIVDSFVVHRIFLFYSRIHRHHNVHTADHWVRNDKTSILLLPFYHNLLFKYLNIVISVVIYSIQIRLVNEEGGVGEKQKNKKIINRRRFWSMLICAGILCTHLWRFLALQAAIEISEYLISFVRFMDHFYHISSSFNWDCVFVCVCVGWAHVLVKNVNNETEMKSIW